MKMTFMRNKYWGTGVLICAGGFACFCALFVFFAWEQPYFSVFAAMFFILFLACLHKSVWISLKPDCVCYRKYFIPRKVGYSEIKAIYLTCYRTIARGIVLDHRAVNVYLMKDAALPLVSQNMDSTKMYGEWSSVYIDFTYRWERLEFILRGGFQGMVYASKDAVQILGKDFIALLQKYGLEQNLAVGERDE